jgi:hypothetical protein
MAQTVRGPHPGGTTLPDIGPAYCAAGDMDGSATLQLVAAAADAGIITGAAPGRPGQPGLVWQFCPDGDGDGYRWLLYGEPGEAIVATHCQAMSGLGGGLDTTGEASALAVLGEAVAAGNMLAAQRTAPPPAQQQADRWALDAIQHMLRDPQWAPGMFEDIAGLVRQTGRDVGNLPGDEPTWDRH